MNIIRYALNILAPRAHAFEEATKNPLRAQEKILLEILRRNQNTEYGKKYNFSKIKSIETYQELAPLSDCDTVRPYIERIKKGEDNVLTSDKVIFFGLTSGTTSHPKFIPVTKYSQAKKAELMDLWVYYISRNHPNIFKGKILAVISPEVEGYTEASIPYGGESGHGYKRIPTAVKHLYVLPYEVFDITDYESRYYTILRIAIEHNVTTVATLNPSSIVLLCQKINMMKEKIIEDIEKGTLDKNLIIPTETRKLLEKTLKPNPKRAEELKAILKEGKELLPKYFWPNMELIECWKSGSVKVYLKELPRFFGDVPIRDLGCLSTEARSSIPVSDEGAGGILAISTNFFEFIPREDISKKKKRILLCDQLETGKDYFIVVTTPGGLCRYNIDDVIHVDGFFNKTPTIEFLQKGLNAVSITGEKVYESQVVEAVNSALELNKIFVKFFCTTVEWKDMPHYVFLVEFTDNLTRDKKKEFLRALEKELCHQNAEYEDKRKQQVLGYPILKVVKNGDFEKYRARRLEEGSHDGQFKLPQLTSDVNFQKNFDIEEEIILD